MEGSRQAWVVRRETGKVKDTSACMPLPELTTGGRSLTTHDGSETT